MSTDLFGNSTAAPRPAFHLTTQQKQQATLLYYWMSLDYLKGLQELLNDLIGEADVTLDVANQQGRDAIFTSRRWGVRDTPANWSTYAFPALMDFRLSVAKDIALRPFEQYGKTAAYECGHMLGEMSTQWMTQEEEDSFKARWEFIFAYANKIDEVAGVAGGKRLDDFSMVLHWKESAEAFPRLPKFRVRRDVECESGRLPVRTGVYVAQDDDQATLQFGWTGNSDGVLGNSWTFNAVGLKILSMIGRDALWLDGNRSIDVLKSLMATGEITDRKGFSPQAVDDPESSGAILSMNSGLERPCKWYFVELIEGEFEDVVTEPLSSTPTSDQLRCEGGNSCPREGYWFTPASQPSRRYFRSGEIMPSVESAYGVTIWQWDKNQG